VAKYHGVSAVSIPDEEPLPRVDSEEVLRERSSAVELTSSNDDSLEAELPVGTKPSISFAKGN
jgi:hypothetical protein